jgi:hypothetical protein
MGCMWKYIKSASYTNSLALIILKNWCGTGSAHTWWKDTGPKLIYNPQDVRNTNKFKSSCCLPSIHMQYGPKLLVLEFLFPVGRERGIMCPPILASSEVEQSIALVCDGHGHPRSNYFPVIAYIHNCPKSLHFLLLICALTSKLHNYSHLVIDSQVMKITSCFISLFKNFWMIHTYFC